MTAIQERLLALGDEKNADFAARLIPNVRRESILGARVPALRALARELDGTAEAEAFLKTLPHTCHEENLLHGLLIERIRDYDACVAALDVFLPFVDNWAVCDTVSPRCFRKNRARLIGDIRRWLDSGALYTVRFGLRMLMNHFLDEDFRPEYLDWAASIETEAYYLRMMQAWFFATALAKQYDAALPVLEQGRLEPWTQYKTIQKAAESFHISEEQKAYLKELKR